MRATVHAADNGTMEGVDMDMLDWTVIGLGIIMVVYTIAWLRSAEVRAALKLKVRLAVGSAVILFGLALTLLFTRLPSPAQSRPSEEEDDQEPGAVLYCYHRTIRDFGARGVDEIDRQQALLRVVPEARPQNSPAARTVPAQPEPRMDRPEPKAAPVPARTPTEIGPSCRLHPRVLEKVLLSIAQDGRRAREA